MFLILGLLKLMILTTTGAGFLDPPSPVTAFLNSTAQFNCSTRLNTSALFWLVDGDSATKVSVRERGIDFYIAPRSAGGGAISVLSIEATERNNNSLILCGIFIYNTPNYSNPVTLKVQGLLAAPGGLTVTTIDSRTLYLKWDPPFTLNVTQVSPDILGYVLHITNLNTTRSRSQRVNESEYVFQRQDWPCFLYAFNVSAVNKVGQGNSSEYVLGSFHGVDMQQNLTHVISQAEISFAVRFLSHGQGFEVTMTLPFLDEFTSNQFTVTLLDMQNNSVYFLNDSLIMSYNFESETVIVFTLHLPTNQFYLATVWVDTSESAIHSEPLNLSTYDVQDVAVMPDAENGIILVSCTFAKGTLASGCFLIFLSLNNLYKLFWVTFRENLAVTNTTVTTLQPSTYTVVVFDLESSGLPSTHAAFITEFTAHWEHLEMEYEQDVLGINETRIEIRNETFICIHCYFEANSDAAGCVVILHTVESAAEIVVHSLRRVSRQPSLENCYQLTSTVSNYSIAIFSWEDSGRISERPIFVAYYLRTASITAKETPPTLTPAQAATSSASVTVSVTMVNTSGTHSTALITFIGISSGSAIVGIVMAILITATGFLIVRKCLSKGNESNHCQDDDIQMQDNSAYAKPPQWSTSQPRTRPNPAYEASRSLH